MRSLITLILISATVTYAQDPLPVDAPIMFETAPGYVCIPTEQRLNEGKAIKRCVDEKATLIKDNVVIPVPAFVAITVGGVVLGAVVTGLIIGFAKK